MKCLRKISMSPGSREPLKFLWPHQKWPTAEITTPSSAWEPSSAEAPPITTMYVMKSPKELPRSPSPAASPCFSGFSPQRISSRRLREPVPNPATKAMTVLLAQLKWSICCAICNFHKPDEKRPASQTRRVLNLFICNLQSCQSLVSGKLLPPVLHRYPAERTVPEQLQRLQIRHTGYGWHLQ